MRLADYHFDLPPELIAQHPAPERDQSRLLVLDRAEGSIRHRRFCDLVEFVAPADVLVLNQTRVFPARLKGRRVETGAAVELLLIRPLEEGCWLAMGRPGRRLSRGSVLELAQGRLRAEVAGRAEGGRIRVRFACADVAAALEELGEVPLPPYIRRPSTREDRQRYQTVFARLSGAVAAPTAGLHFTPRLLRALEARGTAVAPVLLHVGPGTFEPIRSADPRRHRLEPEYYEVGEESAARIARRRREGGRVVAVGTTTVRALETAAAAGRVRAGGGWSAKFIYPPYRFGAVDALVTNFHLPGSSLLLLVAAFAGRELILEAYGRAVEEGYRFYSYGDAMLIV